MKSHWKSYDAWVAHFDILGFKSLLTDANDEFSLYSLKNTLNEVISSFTELNEHFFENIEYCFYSDTFVIYSKTSEDSDYLALMLFSKNFIRSCIQNKIPIRGAISFGELIIGYDQRVLMGKAFLESYTYGEDQNWIGLILTPSATQQLKKNDLCPSRQGFINRDIPMRKCSVSDIYAYFFINGSTSFECTLLSPLKEMMSASKESEKVKYENTIAFINKHYKVHKSS